MSSYFKDGESALCNQPVDFINLEEHLDIMDTSFYIIIERLQRKGIDKSYTNNLMERFDDLYNDISNVINLRTFKEVY